jgi:UV DNA damage endonuclease
MQTTCSGENKTSVKDWVQAQIKEEENEKYLIDGKDFIDDEKINNLLEANQNPSKEKIREILKKAFDTWKKEKFVPKIHFSSPKDEKRFRNHADFINPEEFNKFLDVAKKLDRDFDIMIEAKEKDNALLELRKNIAKPIDI